MSDIRENAILNFLKIHRNSSSKEIHTGMAGGMSYATVKRLLTKLADDHMIALSGKGKGTKYALSPVYELLQPVDINLYFQKEIDERAIHQDFNFGLMEDVLARFSIFSSAEQKKLNELHQVYQSNIAQLSTPAYKKELERLAIDLSWKSSQIEGNTYSLLETERLLKDKETAAGKTKEEAIMLLNHKAALDFIIDHPDYLWPLQVSKIEDIHGMLIKDLGVERNLRKTRLGISGTNYRPPDNDFQIREALTAMCQLIHSKPNVFEKALLALVLISYIQPFMDGNKRTARIVSNAILMHAGYCPLSYRTADSLEYKKAMLLFYEQNNISAMKALFINQFDFAVNTYF